MALPTHLRLDIGGSVQKPPLRIELCDYAGALVQALPNQSATLTRQLNQEVKEWLASSQAVLFFIDSNQPEMEQIDALDLLLVELRKPCSDGPTLEIPLGLVLTKWDSHGPISDDADRERERAHDFLRANPIFRQIADKVEENTQRLRVFPVSAFGNHVQGNKPPPSGLLIPCHLHAPLLWAAQQTNDVLLERARAVARRHLDQSRKIFDLTIRKQPDYNAARQVYEGLRRDYGIGQGPLSEQVQQEIDNLETDHWRNRIRYATGFAIALGLILLWLASRGRSNAKQAYAAVEDLRQAHPAWEEAAKRLDQEQVFLKSWQTFLHPSAREKVAEWIRNDAEIVEEQSAAQLTRDNGLLLEKGKKFSEAIGLYRCFGEQFPKSRYVDEFQNRVVVLLPIVEKCAAQETWQAGTRLENESKLSEAIELYRGFSSRFPKSRLSGDFEDRVVTLLSVIKDRDEYQMIFQLGQQGTNPDAMERLYARSKEYLRGPRREKGMRKQVQIWYGWFEGLRKDGEYYIVVESVSIHRDSDLDATFGTEPRVEVIINDKPYTTPWFKGNEVTMNQQLGPYPFRWGAKSSMLHVRVDSRHRLRSNDEVAGEIRGDRFILHHANGPFVLRCNKGKEIIVHLRCNAAVPPELPPYRRP